MWRYGTFCFFSLVVKYVLISMFYSLHFILGHRFDSMGYWWGEGALVLSVGAKIFVTALLYRKHFLRALKSITKKMTPSNSVWVILLTGVVSLIFMGKCDKDAFFVFESWGASLLAYWPLLFLFYAFDLTLLSRYFKKEKRWPRYTLGIFCFYVVSRSLILHQFNYMAFYSALSFAFLLYILKRSSLFSSLVILMFLQVPLEIFSYQAKYLHIKVPFVLDTQSLYIYFLLLVPIFMLYLRMSIKKEVHYAS